MRNERGVKERKQKNPEIERNKKKEQKKVLFKGKKNRHLANARI
jgi:hypothetical protein